MNIEKTATEVIKRLVRSPLKVPVSALIRIFTVAEHGHLHKELLAKVGLESTPEGWVIFEGERIENVVWTPLRYPFVNLQRMLPNCFAVLTLIDESIEFDEMDEDGGRTAVREIGRSSAMSAKMLGLEVKDILGTIKLDLEPEDTRVPDQETVLEEDAVEEAQQEVTTRVVVCAANKYGPFVYIGIRHFCPIMQQNMRDANIPLLRNLHGEVQGFVDQWGVFMDRKEALAVAKAAGQINVRRPKNPGNWLHSEDLY